MRCCFKDVQVRFQLKKEKIVYKIVPLEFHLPLSSFEACGFLQNIQH